MKFNTVLNPSQSVGVGVGIGAVDLLIFSHFVPSITDIRSAHPQNDDVETSRRQATIACVGLNGLVSLMVKDWNVFLIGGMVTAAMSWLVVHANHVHPDTGTMKAPGEQAASSNMNMYPLPDYSIQSESA
jgi:hypothetical protein